MSTEARRQPSPPSQGEQLRLPEPFNAKRNSFADFVMSPVAQTYIDGARELQGEISTWLKSQSFQNLEEELSSMLTVIAPRVDTELVRAKAKRAISIMAYGYTTDTGTKRLSEFIGMATVGKEKEIESILKPDDEFDEYTATIDPLKEKHKEATNEVMDNYGHYLKNHFYDQDISSFLNSPSKHTTRAKPILDLLTKDAFAFNSVLGEYAHRQREQANQLNEQHLPIYINKIRDKLRQDPSWSLISVGLRAAGMNPHEVSTDIIVNSILNDKSKISERFIIDYRQSIQGLISETVTKIKSALEPYKQKPITLDLVNHQAPQKGKRIPKQQVQGIRIESLVAMPEESIPEPYSIALYKQSYIQELNQAALENYMHSIANKFARNDERMKTDVQNMIESIQKNPFGAGVKRMAYNIKVEGKSIALRRLDPRNPEREIVLNHEISPRIRIVYGVEPSQNRIIIDNVLHHPDFDSLYPL